MEKALGITGLVVVPEHIEHRRPRKQQRDIIGALDEPLFDIAKVLRITKRRKHERLYAALVTNFPLPFAMP
jgi:hypothetical protein